MGRFREPDEASFFHVERHHRRREQPGALAGDHSAQEQTGVVKGGAAGQFDLVDALRLKPKAPAFAVGVMDV